MTTQSDDPRPGRRVLVLLPFVPRLDAIHGGGRATAQLHAALATRQRVALLCLRGDNDPPIDPVLHERCEWVETIARPPLPASQAGRWCRRARLLVGLLRGRPMWVTDWGVPAYTARVRDMAAVWRPEIVQFEYHIMGQYAAALDGSPAPRVLVEHEPGDMAARASAEVPGSRLARALRRLDRTAWTRYERALMRRVQAVVTFTDDDKRSLARVAGRTPIVRIPLGTPLPAVALDPLGHAPWSLLFVGNFIHPPNVDAALRLARSIFPHVQARYPQLLLRLIGDRPHEQLRILASPSILVTGYVPDVTPFLDAAALVVAPLRLGGGMRVKVLEALAAGKAVIASPLAIAGLNVVDGEHVVIAETDDQFVAAIARLLDDAQGRAALAARARRWASANLGWQRPVRGYERLYEALLAGRADLDALGREPSGQGEATADE